MKCLRLTLTVDVPLDMLEGASPETLPAVSRVLSRLGFEVTHNPGDGPTELEHGLVKCNYLEIVDGDVVTEGYAVEVQHKPGTWVRSAQVFEKREVALEVNLLRDLGVDARAVNRVTGAVLP